jgi:hypothetical protein
LNRDPGERREAVRFVRTTVPTNHPRKGLSLIDEMGDAAG